MRLKCVTSECPWFTVDSIYNVQNTWPLQWIFDNEGEEWYVYENTNGQYQIVGVNDATFEGVSE